MKPGYETYPLPSLLTDIYTFPGNGALCEVRPV